MSTEWCYVCGEEFDPQKDDGQMVVTFKQTLECPEEIEYMCHECVDKAIMEHESREAAAEDYGRAKMRGEL